MTKCHDLMSRKVKIHDLMACKLRIELIFLSYYLSPTYSHVCGMFKLAILVWKIRNIIANYGYEAKKLRNKFTEQKIESCDIQKGTQPTGGSVSL